MEKEQKYDIIRSIIEDRIGKYLYQFGYAVKGIAIVPNINNTESLEMCFENTKRRLYFRYQDIDINHNESEYVFLHISNKKNISYIIHDILDHNGISYNKKSFSLLTYTGSFEERVNQLCDYIISLFDNYLQDWISGEKWEDIPFDWGPYK